MEDKAKIKLKQPVDERICSTKSMRERLCVVIGEYVENEKVARPLPFEKLLKHAGHLLDRAGFDEKYRDYAAVLLHNEIWRPHLADIPFNRRLLLLPKCLRNEKECKGSIDQFGLLCARCGQCVLYELITEAEQLGYVVMVAEGSPLVTALIESGQIEAVVGVSCLAVLEKVFPYIEASAVPGVAIPLLNEGCENTDADLDWVWDAIYLKSDDPKPRLDIEQLRNEVRVCFDDASLKNAIGPMESETEKIAWSWLAKSGKRWRPFLSACVFKTMQKDPTAPLPNRITKLLLAVEAFHKASLIHDDIEDEDVERYGEKTVHAEWGVPIALNAGDLLVGEGYRLISDLDVSPEMKAKLLTVAAAGHKTLCMGQGAELSWIRNRTPLSSKDVISIFRQKTAPAFEVALRMGAIFTGVDDDLGKILHQYSEALGIAYQIRDDLADSGLLSGVGMANPDSMGPSLLLALAHEQATGEDRNTLESIWRKDGSFEKSAEKLSMIMREHDVVKLARGLLNSYKDQAISAILKVESVDLKIALHRVVGKIFSDQTKMGCCDDYQTEDA